MSLVYAKSLQSITQKLKKSRKINFSQQMDRIKLIKIAEISLKVKFDLISLISCEVYYLSDAGSRLVADCPIGAITCLLHSKKHQNNVSSATAFVGKSSNTKDIQE
jgi:hypothetical protein